MQFINPSEAIKRLAAAQGIDYLNLIKTDEQLQQEAKQQQDAARNQELLKQAGQFVNSPAMDPTKNPDAIESLQAMTDNTIQANNQSPT